MPRILLSGNANAYPPIAGSLPAVPLERCDSLNSLLAKRKQAAASAFTPIPASSNMIAMLEAEDKQAGTLKKVRVTGSQTESDDDGTEPQDVAAGARSFGDNGGQSAGAGGLSKFGALEAEARDGKQQPSEGELSDAERAELLNKKKMTEAERVAQVRRHA